MYEDLYEKARELRLSGLGYKTIAKQLSLGETQITNWCRDIKLSQEQLDKIRKTNLKYEYKYDFLESPREIAYYLLGTYFTDGCLSKNYKELILTSKDKEWLENISKIFVVGGKHLIKNKCDNCYRLTINNKKIINWFIENNMQPAKTLTITCPEIPKEYIKDFLRGVIDGDGSIVFRETVKDNNKRKHLGVSVVSASKVFSDQLCSFIKELGASCNLYIENLFKRVRKTNGREIKNNHMLYRVYLGSSESVKLCEKLYDGNSIYLKRKYENYIKYLSAREKEKKDISKVFKMRYLTKEEMLEKVKTIGVAKYAKELTVTPKGLLKKLHKLGIYIKSF